LRGAGGERRLRVHEYLVAGLQGVLDRGDGRVSLVRLVQHFADRGGELGLQGVDLFSLRLPDQGYERWVLIVFREILVRQCGPAALQFRHDAALVGHWQGCAEAELEDEKEGPGVDLDGL